jgi:hypothetical protein
MELPTPTLVPDNVTLGVYLLSSGIIIAFFLLIIVLAVGIIVFLALIVRNCLRFLKRVRK